MAFPFRILLMSLAFCFASLVSLDANAMKIHCQHCKCHPKKHHHEKLHLVCGFEEIEVPVYECTPKQVFCPHKGAICQPSYRCETHYTLKKFKSKCHYVKCLCCKTMCGCKKDVGGSPAGCFKDCNVKLPTGTKKILVPTFRWVAEHECEHCHGNIPMHGSHPAHISH